MANNLGLTIFELENKLESEPDSIGSCIGLNEEKCWQFLVYIGEGSLLVLYKKNAGIFQDSLNYLQNNLQSGFDKDVGECCVRSIRDLKTNRSMTEIYKYDLNIFKTATNNKLKPLDLLKIIEFNLNQIEILEEGDIIMFERGFYHHSALLIDTDRMLCIHRSGEPDNPGDSYIASSSLLGTPTEKASVVQDHLIEIAGYSRLKKSNEIFDKNLSPKAKEDIIKEAKKRLGEKGYSVMSMNCQHFVSECRNGSALSPEVQQVANGALYTGFFGMMSILIAVSTRLLTSTRKPAIETKKN